jgi:replicative DNA helicase
MIVFAARPSMGKCLAFDSKILLSDGSIVTIEEVYRKQQASFLTLKENWKLALTSPTNFVDDGLKPVFRVATRLGKVIKATMPHPFLTISGWKKLSELQPGDRIAVPRKLNVFGRHKWRDCEIKLLAYLIGDGCLTGTNPRFTSGNTIVQEEFAAAVLEFGGLKTQLFDSHGTRTPSFRVASNRELIRKGRLNFGATLRKAIGVSGQSSRGIALAAGVSPVSLHEWKKGNCAPTKQAFLRLCEVLQSSPAMLAPTGLEAISKNSRNSLTVWLEQLGIWGRSAHTKQIPAQVFNLARSQLALFLNRLFATDGWATLLTGGQTQLGYATVSEELARQVQHLLLRFGVVASLRKRSVKYNSTRRTAWQLDITDKLSIQTFISEIGIFGREKATEAVRAILTTRKYQTNRDLIPREIWASITENKGSESWAALARRAKIKGHTNIHVGRRSPTRQRLATLAAALENESLREIAESDVYWDQIVSIRPAGLEHVYDLTIPETHNFVANDICVHNTALAMNIAEHVAINEMLPVGVFSLEMSSQQLVQRLLCSRARVNLQKVRDGFLGERDFPSLTAAASKLAEAKIFIDDSASLTILELRAKARRLKAQQDVQLIIVDYLQLLRSTSRRAQDNRQLEISEISAGLKGLAKELKIPLIVVAQLNRQPEQRSGGKPRLSDLRESGAIEQDADLVGLLVRPEIYEEDDEARAEKAGEAELIIAKQRNGPVGEIPLTFLKEFTRFETRARNVSEPEEAF